MSLDQVLEMLVAALDGDLWGKDIPGLDLEVERGFLGMLRGAFVLIMNQHAHLEELVINQLYLIGSGTVVAARQDFIEVYLFSPHDDRSDCLLPILLE